jgi:hypothetical protein
MGNRKYQEKLDGDGETIFIYECPNSLFKSPVWRRLELMNECMNKDNCLNNLPFEGAVTDQPKWFRQTFKIVKSERAWASYIATMRMNEKIQDQAREAASR